MSSKWNQPRDGETWAEFEIRKQREEKEEPFLEETVEEPAPPPPKKATKQKRKPPPPVPPVAPGRYPYKPWPKETVKEEDKDK